MAFWDEKEPGFPSEQGGGSDLQSGPIGVQQDPTQSNDGAVLPGGTLNDWGAWAQSIGKVVIGGAVDMYKYRQIANAGGIPEVGQNGQLYTVGQRMPTKPAGSVNVGGMSISPMIILGAAGLVALLLVMRK